MLMTHTSEPILQGQRALSGSRQEGVDGQIVPHGVRTAQPVQAARLSAPAVSTHLACQRPQMRNHRISWSSKTATGVWQRTSK